MNTFRKVQIGAVSLAFFAVSLSFAQEKSWKGESVLFKRPSDEIKIIVNKNGKEVSFPLSGTWSIQVREEKNNRLLIQDGRNLGWVAKADFILVNDAPAFFHRMFQNNPKNTWALFMRGAGWQLKGEIDNAIKDFSECIRIDPTDEYYYYNRGLAWNENGEIDKAIKDYTEAIGLAPNLAMAYYNRGNAWTDKKEYNKAIKDYTEGIRLDPNNPDAFINRGWAWIEKKEYEKAIKDCNEAIRLDPNEAQAFINRGLAWLAKKDIEKATKDFTEAIRLDPNGPEAYYNRGLAWVDKKEYHKAIKDYSEAIRLDPTDSLFLNNLAWLLATCPDARFRDGKRAVELAKQACELTQWKAIMYLDTLAAAYAEIGDFEKAVEYQKKALEDEEFAKDKDGQARLKLYEKKQPYRE